VRIKISSRHGAILNTAPEFDDCLQIARRTGRSLKEVQADAVRAWHARGSERADPSEGG
jgi:uncharacterized protein (DUF111 family)